VDKKVFSTVAKIVFKGENRKIETLSLAFVVKEDIKKLNGTDITKEILSEALNKTEDMYGYHRVLDNLAKDIPDIKKHISQFIESI
jgi:lipopolysaccharide biosynthesis regulator YciM